MKNATKFLLSILFLLAGFVPSQLKAANYYWVGGSGDWSDFANHWATTSGGSTFHTQAPDSLDNVFFDAGSFSIPTDQVHNDLSPARCNSMNWTGASTAGIWGGYVFVYGSLTLNNDLNFGVGINFHSDKTGNTIEMFGNKFPANVNFSGKGDWTITGKFSVAGDLIIDGGSITTGGGFFADGDIMFNKGSIATIGDTISGARFRSETKSVRTLDLTSSVVDLQYYWWISDATNFTLDAGTSTILVGYPGVSFEGASLKYSVVKFVYPLAASSITITGANTYDSLIVENSKEVHFEGGTTQQFKYFSMPDGSNCTDFSFIRSEDGNPVTLKKLTATPYNCNYTGIMNVKASGATFNAVNSIGVGSVTGWTITPFAGKTLYWVGDGGNWDSPTHWSTTSGGGSAGCIPTLADDVRFDAQSFINTGQTVTVNVAAYCKSMDWTGVKNNPLFAGNQPLTINGSLTFDPGMGAPYNGSYSFVSSAANNTLYAVGLDPYAGVNFSGTGTYKLTNDFSMMHGNLSFNSGTLNTNGYNVNVSNGDFISNSSVTRTLDLGNSVVAVANWDIKNSQNMTLVKGKSHIYYGGQFSSDHFNGGGLSYHYLKLVPNIYGDIAFHGSNSFDSLVVESMFNNLRVLFDTSTTQTVGQLVENGSATYSVTLRTNVPGKSATIHQTSGQFCGDYLAVDDIKAFGVPFYAGANSFDGGGNTGWTFSACVPLTVNSVVNEIAPVIYPNPSTGKFIIELSNNHPATMVEVYNMIGEKIMLKQISKELDLSGSPKGIYFVKVHDGSTSFTKKIVVE